MGSTTVLIELTALGLMVGFGSGMVARIMLRTGRSSMVPDALIGAVSFVAIALVISQFGERGDSTGGAIENMTLMAAMESFRHPLWIAFPVAILLPILRQARRGEQHAQSSEAEPPRSER